MGEKALGTATEVGVGDKTIGVGASVDAVGDRRGAQIEET